MSDSTSKSGNWLTSGSLLLRAKSGAWEELFTLYGPLVLKWCRNGLEWTNKEGQLSSVPPIPERDIADVEAEVKKNIYESLERFEARGEGSFRKWLKTITSRRMVDYWRKSIAEPEGGSGAWSDNVPFFEDDSREPSESYGVVQLELREVTERALNNVRDQLQSEDKTWKAFYCMAFEERTSVDCAAELGMTPAAVRMAKIRVTKALREMFDGLEGFDDLSARSHDG